MQNKTLLTYFRNRARFLKTESVDVGPQYHQHARGKMTIRGRVGFSVLKREPAHHPRVTHFCPLKVEKRDHAGLVARHGNHAQVSIFALGKGLPRPLHYTPREWRVHPVALPPRNRQAIESQRARVRAWVKVEVKLGVQFGVELWRSRPVTLRPNQGADRVKTRQSDSMPGAEK